MNEMRYDRWGLKRDNPRVSAPDAFHLYAREYLGARPCGDGWETVVEERQWNVTPKMHRTQKNPLNLRLRIKPPRKQAAARMVRPIEAMDDRHVYVVDVEDPDMYFDLGRNEGEVRPNSAVQGMRGVNFDMGAKYSGGQAAIREAMRKRKELLAGPKKESAAEVRNTQIADLERRIKALLGLVKK